jgi:hypothetical protein
MQHRKSSIKIQYNNHQSEITSSIAILKDINKFNFALVMIMYDMEKPFFLHCNKGI